MYRRGDVLWRRTTDRVIILLPASGEFLVLQGTGCDLWDALKQPRSLDELAERLSGAYGATVQHIAADIAPVLEELTHHGAVALRREDTSP